MQFLIHKDAGEQCLKLQGDSYHHLFRSRRTKKTQFLHLRNLRDLNCYIYSIHSLDKKEALLHLVSSENTELTNPPKGHLIWAIIEPKNIEKTLPILNECNLQKITFFYAEYSQKNFKLSQERLQKILENSCEQCGRITVLEIEFLNNLQEILTKYPHLAILDFKGEALKSIKESSILVGPEGGFSANERSLLKDKPLYSALNCNILRSENAAIYATLKYLTP
ncbi:16S rRNA (uracil(1498)-N(3))-methyltransferase [Helicobacter mesocricetorum]|uniref:16S rRNA (uracil(1498)-N(3))-methyltransferase n=1 Tax=Helicobacter mesocricetorum TaxID=87012 RepID=UPI000CF09579|nr:16S rRNA (uracil(1498)-N(3))-methyltransferase [Helicobacter mesocricetorum]